MSIIEHKDLSSSLPEQELKVYLAHTASTTKFCSDTALGFSLHACASFFLPDCTSEILLAQLHSTYQEKEGFLLGLLHSLHKQH